MRPALPAIGAVAALVLLAGCASGQTRAVFKLPHCPASLNTCLMSIDISRTHGGTVTGFITLKTQQLPRAWELFTSLALWNGRLQKWIIQDEKTYHLGQLPRVGHIKVMQPELQAYCAPHTKWQIYGHLNAVANDGTTNNGYFYYPGSKKDDTFLASIRKIKVKYNVYIKNCLE